MNRYPVLLTAGIIAVAALLMWNSAALPVTPRETPPPANATLAEAYQTLIGARCVVTLDPQATPLQPAAGTAEVKNGFVAPNLVRGIVERIDSEWLILSDGRDTHWIPRSKVLLIYTSK